MIMSTRINYDDRNRRIKRSEILLARQACLSTVSLIGGNLTGYLSILKIVNLPIRVLFNNKTSRAGLLVGTSLCKLVTEVEFFLVWLLLMKNSWGLNYNYFENISV